MLIIKYISKIQIIKQKRKKKKNHCSPLQSEDQLVDCGELASLFLTLMKLLSLLFIIDAKPFYLFSS